MSKKTRILLFEDNKNLAKSFLEYVEDSETLFVTGWEPNANDAVKAVKKYLPDLILMDIEMPGTSGIEAVRIIREVNKEVKILMLTVFEEDDKIFAALCNGANGYALKDPDPEVIIKGIHDLIIGGGFISPSIASKVIRMMGHPLVTTQPDYIPLTDRQKEVLGFLVKGFSRKMIAAELAIGADTVGDHFKEIYRKLHVNSGPEAVREAILRKLI